RLVRRPAPAFRPGRGNVRPADRDLGQRQRAAFRRPGSGSLPPHRAGPGNRGSTVRDGGSAMSLIFRPGSSLLAPRSFRLLLLFALLVAALAGGGYATWRWRWAEQLLAQGENALAGREYTKAHALLARYLSLWPGDKRAHLLAARVARRLKQYDEAEE